MLVTHGFPRAGHAPVALTIGNFDGVHTAHQAIIARVIAEARSRGLASCVLTFEPHPREFFERHREAVIGSRPNPPPAPTRLTSPREKLEVLAQVGVDRVHVQHFTRGFADLSPESFVSEVLDSALHARWVMVGDDFCFGARRAGNFALLDAMSARFGFKVESMPTLKRDGVRVSSGVVREALARGELARARELLGRHYSISGRVVRGDMLGRSLGFPTANVQMKHNRPPLSGVFAVRFHGAGSSPLYGAASLGVRPTVKSGAAAVLEVHLFDFAGELYGRHVRVEFLHKIRDEEKFSDLAALRAQIARDCEAAKNFLMDQRDV
jgi:riboflavin kinase/FMN adenylyltransferase